MVRYGTLEDCHAVYLLICEMENCELDYSAFEKIYRKFVICDSYAVLLAVIDNSVVGELTLRFEEQLHHCAKIAEIMELAVKAHFRSRGIGSLLFEKACELAENQNCIQIEVSSNKVRLRAHKFYERLGVKNTHFKFCKELF